jgi:hypothetical protein
MQESVCASSVEQDIQEIHQRRTQAKDMLNQVIDACHSFFLRKWETETYQLLNNVTALIERIRTAYKDIHVCLTTPNLQLRKFHCVWFYTFFQLARQCEHALISPYYDVYPTKMRRNYKQEHRVLPHLSRCVQNLRVVAESSRQQMLVLAPKAQDAFIAALYRACPLESMYAVANDGSRVICVTTIATSLMGINNDSYSMNDRLQLDEFVRAYLNTCGIYDAEDRVQLTTINEHGVLSTHSAFAYREHHVPVLAKACLSFVLGERMFLTNFLF